MITLKDKIKPKYWPMVISTISGLLMIAFWASISMSAKSQSSQLQVRDMTDIATQVPALRPKDEENEFDQEDQFRLQTPGSQQQFPITISQPTATQNTPPKIKTPSSTTAAQVQNTGIYKDGTYQASSQTPWGIYTISIKVTGGNWTNVTSISVPNSPPSQYSANTLARQALQAQNATIDGVSGATYTSDAFRDDLNQIVQQSKA